MTYNFLLWPLATLGAWSNGDPDLSDVGFAWPVTVQGKWPPDSKHVPTWDTESKVTEIWIVFTIANDAGDLPLGVICNVGIGGIATTHEEALRIMLAISRRGFDGDIFVREYPVNVALYQKDND